MIATIKVIPKSSSNEIVGWRNDQFVIKVTTSPEKQKANKAVVKLLSKTYNIPTSSITILSGQTNSIKKIELLGIDTLEI